MSLRCQIETRPAVSRLRPQSARNFCVESSWVTSVVCGPCYRTVRESVNATQWWSTHAQAQGAPARLLLREPPCLLLSRLPSSVQCRSGDCDVGHHCRFATLVSLAESKPMEHANCLQPRLAV